MKIKIRTANRLNTVSNFLSKDSLSDYLDKTFFRPDRFIQYNGNGQQSFIYTPVIPLYNTSIRGKVTIADITA